MKASRAQAQIAKQQEQIISLLTMVAGAVGLEAEDVFSALDKGQPITPIKKPKRTKTEVEADKAKELPEKEKPDSRDMSKSVPEESNTGDDTEHPLPSVENKS